MIYDIEQIQEILPHRYPMLLVDRIEEITDTTVKGVKCVTANEQFFCGHFPQKKVMPGVLIVEALAQTGAVVLLSRPQNKGKLAMFAGINNVRFKGQVVPGDVLNLSVELTKERGPIGFGNAVATVDGKVVCQGELMFAITD